jgi:hypothetical protein
MVEILCAFTLCASRPVSFGALPADLLRVDRLTLGQHKLLDAVAPERMADRLPGGPVPRDDLVDAQLAFLVAGEELRP